MIQQKASSSPAHAKCGATPDFIFRRGRFISMYVVMSERACEEKSGGRSLQIWQMFTGIEEGKIVVSPSSDLC